MAIAKIQSYFGVRMFKNFNFIQIRVLLAAGLFISFPVLTVDTIGYGEIGDSLIASFGLVEPVAQVPNQSKDKKPHLATITFTNQQLREKAFSLLSKNDESLLKNPRTQLVKTNLKDLDIYLGRGKNTQAHLMNAIDNTATKIGQAGLAHMLANPLSVRSDLMNRQNLIKELVNNPELLREVESILKQVKISEQIFFSFWQELDQVTADYIKTLYWGSWLNKLNSSVLGLEASVRLGNIRTVYDISKMYLMIVGILYGMEKASVVFIEKFNPELITSGQVKAPSLYKKAIEVAQMALNCCNPVAYINDFKNGGSEDFLKDCKTSFIIQNNRFPNNDETELFKKIGFGLTAAKLGATLGFATMEGFELKKAYAHAAQVKNTHNYLQTRLIGVAEIVDTVFKITKLAQSNATVAQGLFKLEQGKALFNSDNSEFAHLVSLLQTATFNGSASFFSLTGKVLAAYDYIQKHKDKFAPALELIGELDACVSAAKLYNKMRDERVVYSFVEFEQSNTPHVALANFWNPFVNSDVVVTNDIELGLENQKRVMLITGSNTGGKSTVLKAVSIAQLLAHTLTIVPASNATITPLAISTSSMNISDDTAAGNSLFKSEVLRAQSLVELSDSLKNDEFAFIVVDELFTGTDATKGAQAAYKVVNHLAQNPNVVMLIATHFPLLTELEENTVGVCKNYNLDIQKDEQGNLIRSFKLNEGISSSNVAEDILKAEMSNIDFASVAA